MCGRYTITGPDDIADRFDLQLPGPIRANYNAAPGQDLPVIKEDGEGRRLEIMHWGFIPGWAKDSKIGYKFINARSESVFDKPMWKKAIINHRCIIPASGFYEWQKRDGGSKQPFYIHPHESGLFSFAGVWSVWHDPSDGGREVHTYSILTTTPNEEMSAVHDRMPVILSPDDERDWLNPDMSEELDIERFLRPLPDGALEMYEVSTAVNAVKVNDDTLIRPLRR